MNSTRIRLTAVAVLSGILSLSPFITARAQESRGTFAGVVQDTSSAVIPNATVTARDTQTGVQTTAETQADGNYTIPFLAPGTYTITASATGFKSAEQRNITLRVSDRLTVNFNLSLGAVSQVVTVTAAEPLLDVTASRGGLIDNVRVTQLPLVGRNPFMLAQLVPA